MSKKTTAYTRKRMHTDAWQRVRHQGVNPVTEAVVRQRIAADIDRLLPQLHTFSLAGGALKLDRLLESGAGLGTDDVRRALHCAT